MIMSFTSEFQHYKKIVERQMEGDSAEIKVYSQFDHCVGAIKFVLSTLDVVKLEF